MADCSTQTIDDIASRLRAHGVYPTAQRLAIACILLSKHQHVTADDLYDQLGKSGTRVSRATVYNTLNLFVRKGLVRDITVDASRTFYDSNNSHHHHVYNLDNGELIDVETSLPPALTKDLLPQGTTLEDVNLIIKVRNSDN